MVKAVEISKSFGAQSIFDCASFNIAKGERVGLVGRNGQGKTTLLRMIAGIEPPDGGIITVPKGYRIGYLAQHIDFEAKSVINEACRHLPANMQGASWYAEKVLAGLGFSQEQLAKDPADLSGGFQVRLSLACLICSEPDMLLLDEPTNHLDIVSIRWLSSFLRKWKGELLLVTHDRSFMDGVITHVLGIHRRRVRKMAGDTGKYYSQRALEEEVVEKTLANEERKRKQTELFISRFRAKARLAGLVQSRIKALEKQEPRKRPERIKTLDFSFDCAPFPAKTVLAAENLGFGYDSATPLFSGLDLVVNRHDRICVIGPNGRGKTTLLRVIAGELAPCEGSIKVHPEARIGYFAQTNRLDLNDSLTIEQEIMGSGCTRQRARDICGLMMFGGDLATKRVGVLSGGEKSRVLLGKVLASPSNLLLLDEPTNHLDMESCEAFLSALVSFEGAVVMVTHNEMYLDCLAKRLVVFQGGSAFLFEGTYREFLEKVGWADEKQQEESRETRSPDRKGLSKKELRRKRAEEAARLEALLGPVKSRIAEIEHAIEQKEVEMERLDREMIEASRAGDGAMIGGLSKASHRVRAEIDRLYEELEMLLAREEDIRRRNKALTNG